MSSAHRARITGMGSYLPERRLTNADLEKMVDTNDEWIMTRVGVKERRIAGPDETSSVMGIGAAKKAIEDAGCDPADIDMVVVATFTPDYPLSITASMVAHAVGAVNAGAVDLAAACTGHVYALATAKAYVDSGVFKKVLVVAADKVSAHVDYEDRRTCILFGDAATAAIVSDEGEGYLIEEVLLGADGSRFDLLYIPAGGTRRPSSEETVRSKQHFVSMQGQEVFKLAVRRMADAAGTCLAKAGLGSEDIRWLVPHQANTRIIEATAKRCAFPMDKVYMEAVRKYGNCSAPSIGVAMHELLEESPLQDGERLLLVAFGAGFTWASAICRKVKG